MRTALVAVLLAAGAVAAFFVLNQDDGTVRYGPGGGFPLDLNNTPPPSGSSFWMPKVVRTLGDPKDSGLGKWLGDFDASPLKAYDFNGDGVKEVVGLNNNSNVYVFDVKTGRSLAQLKTTIPPAWHIERVLNGVEVARLKAGAPPSIVVANHAGYLAVWEYDAGKSSAGAFHFTKKWEHRLDDFHNSPGMDSKATVADLDNDGDSEILAQIEEQGLYCFDAEGKLLWAKDWSGGNAAPAVGDLDGDGKLEAIFVSDGGTVSVFEGLTGKPEWTFESNQQAALGPASIPVAAAVGDLDGDGKQEVLWVSRDAHAREPEVYKENHMAIFAVKGNLQTGKGELLWMRQPAWAHPLSYTQLVVHDVTGDGRPEIFGMDWNTMGHRPGNWEYLGPAHVFALDHQGNDLWVREVDSWWSNKDLALGDFDGDGKLEVLANGARDGYDGLWRFDAATGKVEGFLPSWPWKVERGPIVADVLGNGTMQLLLPVEPLDPAHSAQGAIVLMDLAVKYNAPWPGYPPPPRR